MALQHLRGGVAVIGNAADFTGHVLLDKQLSLELDTGKEKIGDGTTVYESLDYLPGGGSGGMPIADPTGVTTRTSPNDFTGGTYDWAQFPTETYALAWGLVGDAFPRMVVCADPTDGIWLWDGTTDPLADGVNISLTNGTHFLALAAAAGVKIISSDLLFDPAHGSVVHDASDGHTYRLGTAAGVPTATQVT